MVPNDIIERAWQMTQDTATTKRNPPADMVEFVNEALLELRRLRPSLWLSDSMTVTSHTAVTASNYDSLELPVDEQYLEPLAHRVSARVFELDADDEHNAQMVSYHIQQFAGAI